MTLSATPRWERWTDILVGWSGYVSLAISVALDLLLQTRDAPAEQLGTLALAGLAAAWIYVVFTRMAGPCREHPVRALVFFVGLLALAAALMLRQPLYFVFMISGFFYASVLRPLPLAVAGVFATSVLINTLIAGLPVSPDGWMFYLVIIAVQTGAIGFGTVVGEKINEQSEERRQAVARLEAALEENAGLHAQLLAQARETGILDERGRMAREIHDTIAHGLTGIVTQLEAAEQARDRPADHARHVANALRLARESLTEARRSVDASRPEALDRADLPTALAAVADDWSAINGIPVAVTTTGDPAPLHAEIEMALLRTAQEALANVARHARATQAWLTLSYMGDVVTLDVRDDGIGFEVPAGDGGRGTGFGLSAMRQRVARVAGSLAVESEVGVGTAISARVPAVASPGGIATGQPAP
jgi:signal transduction histidine kinase